MSSPRTLERAKQIYDDRRRRDREMQHLNIFGEPGWDILLILFIASEEGKVTPLSRIFDSFFAPVTTTSRWLKVLESKALIERIGVDGEGQKLALSETGIEIMRNHFSG